MKKHLLKVAVVLVIAISMASCYTVEMTVGTGPQTGLTIEKKNHYVIGGLVALSTANIKEMAGNSKNYSVTISHTILDGFIAALTGGLYTPTTTIVKK